MVLAPASALHSWRSSVCFVRRSSSLASRRHPRVLCATCAASLVLSYYFGLALTLRPNTKALRRSGGAFATPVFIIGNPIRKRRGSRPHRPGWHGAGMALLASSAHRFALHSRGSARQELPERKQGRLYSCRSRPDQHKREAFLRAALTCKKKITITDINSLPGRKKTAVTVIFFSLMLPTTRSKKENKRRFTEDVK